MNICFRKIVSILTLSVFISTNIIGPGHAQTLPGPGTVGNIISLSAPFQPVLIKGLQFNPADPLKVDFIVDAGNLANADSESFNRETAQLAKYFLAGLTVPPGELWVNLSPYEAQRIIPSGLGQTELGKVFLEQDYLLKNLTASLIYPESETGKKFWSEVYKQAFEKIGTTELPVDTFNKVWIVPDRPVVYERPASSSAAGEVAYVVDAKLKVMLETDYVAAKAAESASSGAVIPPGEPVPPAADHAATRERQGAAQELSKQIIREVIIPTLEKEVNEGANFAKLRQVYHALILAGWLKRKIAGADQGMVPEGTAQNDRPLVLGLYIDQNKTVGVENGERNLKARVWNEYVEAFKKGVFNFIREEKDPVTEDIIPRKYFSGGFDFTAAEHAQLTSTIDAGKLAPVQKVSFSLEPVSRTRLVDRARKSLESQAELMGSSAVLAISFMAAVAEQNDEYFYQPLNYTQAATRLEEIAGRFWSMFEQDHSIIDKTIRSQPEVIHQAFRPAGMLLAMWIADELSRQETNDHAMKPDTETREDRTGQFTLSLQKDVISEELTRRIMDVVAGRNREGVVTYGRTFDIILPKPIWVEGKKINRIRVKGAFNSAPVPFVDTGEDVTQPRVRINVQKGGTISAVKIIHSPQGTMFWANVMKEFSGMRQAFEAGIPTGIPIGYGRWSWQYSNSPVGFVVIAEEGLRENLFDLLKRNLQQLLKPSSSQAKNIDRVLGRNNKLVLQASQVLRMMHQKGIIHGQAKLHQFSRSAGKVRIYDFETSLLGSNLERQEFEFRMLKDVGDFLVDIISTPLSEMLFKTFYTGYVGDHEYNPGQMLSFLRAYRQFSQRLESQKAMPLADFLKQMEQEPFAKKILNLSRDNAMQPSRADNAEKIEETLQQPSTVQNGGIDLNAAMTPEIKGTTGTSSNGQSMPVETTALPLLSVPGSAAGNFLGLEPVLISIQPVEDLTKLLGVAAPNPH